MASPSLTLPLRQASRQLLTAARPRQIHTIPRRPIKPQPQRNAFQSRRHAGTFAGNAKKLFKENPFSVTLAAGAILVGAYGLFYANYLYSTYIIGAFHKYPEPVAKKLRRALYYTNQDLQPKEAIKYYKQALQIAEEMGVDPFSDEIMGVKIQVASLMEKVRQPARAIQVLEILKRDSLLWLNEFGDLAHNKEKRTRVLKKCVAIGVKLGDLYATPEVYDRNAAEERLVWAVETSLNELARRKREGVKDEDEGEWLSSDEMGAALETLAQNYEAKDQHYLATPLFLQALTLYPNKDCHMVVLMNNLASSLAQQSPRAAAAAQAYDRSQSVNNKSNTPPPIGREGMIGNARIWAEKALEVAAQIQPPERTEECDVGCAVATHNLGEFAEMLGETEAARKRYMEAVSLSRAIGFQEGVDESSARIRELDSKKKA